MRKRNKIPPRFAVTRRGYDIPSVEAYIGEQAEKTELDIKLRYAMELERLKLFRAKWTGAYEELKERYSFGKDALNMESVAVSVKLELEKFLAGSFSLDKKGAEDETELAFKEETARLSEEDERKVRELREKLLQAAERKDREAALTAKKSKTETGAQPAAAFSLEEAANPTESLAEICRYLGL